MWSTNFVPIRRLWKWIELVSNSSNQKGSSRIWFRADSWNVRFGPSYLSVVQRSVNCARFCKMVSTCFTLAIHHAFLLMHFMIVTCTWSKQMRSLGRSRMVSPALTGVRSNIFWIWSLRSQSCIRGTRTRSSLPMMVVVLYRIHPGFNTSTCSFVAFA